MAWLPKDEIIARSAGRPPLKINAPNPVIDEPGKVMSKLPLPGGPE
jgi:hypothetical protein